MMTDTMTPAMVRALAIGGTRAGEVAVAARIAALATAAAALLPEVAIAVDTGVLRLAAPGLVARAFGSRRRGADPRLAQLAGDGR